MCGIAGYYALGLPEPEDPAVLARMVQAVRHRGPDGSGLHVEPRVALGHARLSIIDLRGGAQPLANEDETVWVSFNGEIFNHVELRRELAALGHRFRTQSDTEVIVHQYEEQGPDCVRSFNGDFAFALWDRKRGRLLLARDRAGVRPLYYTLRDGVLVFASEIKALLRYPGGEGRVDPTAPEKCLPLLFPLAPRTPFEGIRELPPGHVIVAERRGLRVRPYWKLDFPESGAEAPRREEEAAEELEALLRDATAIRLRADVPVGAYLSGGLDSSATTALIRRTSTARLRTFSVGFQSAEYDETPWQRRMVEALGTEHSAFACTGSDIAESFPEVIRHTERPVLRTAPAPLYHLARRVRESGFKVVVTGEGADEVLGGYDIFKEAKVRRFWAREPRSARRPLLLGRLYPWLAGLHDQPQRYLQAFFGAGLDRTADPLYSHLPRFELTRRARRFFSPELKVAIGRYDALAELRESLPEGFGAWHPLSQAQYLESAYLLPGYILSSQSDRVAMAHAVEARYPFLDPRVIELGARLPPRLKLRGLREKHILRRALGRYLPPEIAERPKQPYRAPDAESFFGPGAPDYVAELLSPESIARAGCFDPQAVSRLASKCRSAGRAGTADGMALVGILSAQLLHHHFVRGFN